MKLKTSFATFGIGWLILLNLFLAACGDLGTPSTAQPSLNSATTTPALTATPTPGASSSTTPSNTATLSSSTSANVSKLATPTTTANLASSHPNIVFILTDDLDAKEIAFMPKLQALMVEQGLSFSNFFVTDSLCCPSRSSIQRSQYVHNHGVAGNQAPNGGFDKFYAEGDQNSTVGTWLKGAGYRTALMGKYLNEYGFPRGAGSTYVPPGWDEWDSPIENGGYAEFNYKMNENGKLVSYGKKPEDYLTDVLSNKATTFIQQSAKTNAPFFLYLASYAPHQPATPAPRDEQLFANATAPRTASFNEADVSTKPQFIQNLPLLTKKQIDEIDQLYRKRLQSLQAVDDLIGQLFDTLKSTGQLDNTYIFFTSDNGFHLGQHRMQMGKQTAYEEDIHVPLIVRGPGIAPAQKVDQLGMEIDFGPTFAQLAHTSLPDFVDGRSLVPLFNKESDLPGNWRQAVLIEHYFGSDEPNQSAFEDEQHLNKKKAIPTYKALRTGRYLYVEYETGEKELYDLSNDPDELHNIVTKADNNLLGQFSARLKEMASCKAEGCRSSEEKPLPG